MVVSVLIQARLSIHARLVDSINAMVSVHVVSTSGYPKRLITEHRGDRYISCFAAIAIDSGVVF